MVVHFYTDCAKKQCKLEEYNGENDNSRQRSGYKHQVPGLVANQQITEIGFIESITDYMIEDCLNFHAARIRRNETCP